MESTLRRAGLSDPALHLIETLGWDGHAFVRLPLHLSRMAAGAAALGWRFDAAAVRSALTDAVAGAAVPQRLRLTLDARGPQAAASPMPAPVALWRLGLARTRLASADPWLTLKSSRRAAYEATRAALPADLDEALFLNERGEVCDGTITTLFFDRGHGLCTPPTSAGLLPGVLRAEMLATGACREASLTVAELAQVRLWCGNALRGLAPARWIGTVV